MELETDRNLRAKQSMSQMKRISSGGGFIEHSFHFYSNISFQWLPRGKYWGLITEGCLQKQCCRLNTENLYKPQQIISKLQQLQTINNYKCTEIIPFECPSHSDLIRIKTGCLWKEQVLFVCPCRAQYLEQVSLMSNTFCLKESLTNNDDHCTNHDCQHNHQRT